MTGRDQRTDAPGLSPSAGPTRRWGAFLWGEDSAGGALCSALGGNARFWKGRYGKKCAWPWRVSVTVPLSAACHRTAGSVESQAPPSPSPKPALLGLDLGWA